jgi:hypothetical protein
MNHELAHYYFVPVVRDGLAAFISAEPEVGAERALIKARAIPSIDESDTVAPTINKCVGLYGPGDVLGFDPSVVTRTDPRMNVWDYEPNFMPLIEFGGEPDLPWRFTPKPAAETAGAELQPWITLVVLREDEYSGLGERLRDDQEDKKALPIRWINEVDVQALPNLQHASRWAHVQLTAEDDLQDTTHAELHSSALVDRISGEPGAEASHVVARLICPRRLAPRTKYTAFVVPTFKIALVAAGLHTLGSGENPLDFAWSGTGKIKLPYYYKWEFATSVRGDFEYLVELLQPRPLPNLGKRRMDCAGLPYGLPPCPGSPDDPEVLHLEGALISPRPDAEPARWTNETSEIVAFRNRLAGVLNLPAANLALGPDADRPPVTPPIFGRRHSGRQTVDAAATQPWIDDLNLDPRQRAAAGFGALVVEKQQEALMASVWDQLGDIEAANEVLRHGEFGLEASNGLFGRLGTLSMPDFLWTTAPVFGRVLARQSSDAAATTVAAYVKSSSLPSAAFDPAFRRMLRRGGGIRKRQGNRRPPPRGRDLLTRLNNGGIVAAGAPPKLEGMPSLCGVTDRAIRTLEELSEPQRRAQNRFRINGKVIARTTRRGVPGVRVESWDRDPFFTDKVGDALTNARGNFRIEFDPSYFRERFFDRRPDVFFKVFQGGRELKVTAPSVMRDVGAGDTNNIMIEVDMDAAPPREPTFRITGTVTDRSTQKPVPWITVEAWDKDMFRDDLLAGAMTNEHGVFRIEFNDSYFNELSADPEPDIYFKVYHRGRLIHSTAQSVRRNVPRGEHDFPIQIDAPSPLPERPGSRVFDFCEEAITCDAIKAAIAAAPNLGLHSEAGNAICDALRDWLAPAAPAAQPPPADLTALYETVKGAIAPWVTIPARVASRIQIGPGVHQRGVLTRLESEVEFPSPMYEPLAAISQDLILPGVETVPQNTISIVATNRRFIESYMLGLNDGLAGEALWRGAPVYLWTSFFRQFWDVSGLVEPAADPEVSKDITRLTRWSAGSMLGDHNPRDQAAQESADGPKEQACLLVRGDVLKRYPNTLVYAIEADTEGAPSWGADRIWPIFSGSLAPDLTFLGFDKSPKDLCKYFIVLEERLGEPRFGFDLLEQGAELPELPASNWWYELTWAHFRFPDDRAVEEDSYINDAMPVTDGDRSPAFDFSSAATANICLQRPVRVAIHASKMLSKEVCA